MVIRGPEGLPSDATHPLDEGGASMLGACLPDSDAASDDVELDTRARQKAESLSNLDRNRPPGPCS